MASATSEGSIVLRNVQKSFGPAVALRDATIEIRSGEVHALVGENGSGKSTLIKLLSGVHRPDSGELLIDGEQSAWPTSPRRALATGIATVFQEVLVTENQSVLENVWLGVDGLVRARVSEREKRARAAEALDSLLGRVPDLDSPIADLSLSDRQSCAIVRSLLREPRLLILDEATASLDLATRARLFGMVRALRDGGRSTLFITHRMDEIAELGDRITVVRSGATVATVDAGEWDVSSLVRLMTGSDHLTTASEEVTHSARNDGVPLMRVENLRLDAAASAFDFELRAGELVGVAGLEGHGQEAFLKSLWGAHEAAPESNVLIADGGTWSPVLSPRDAVRSGIGYVPRERRRDGLFGSMSIADNFALPTLELDTRAGIIRQSSIRRRFESYVRELRIKLSSLEDAITTLSGGNQQKVLIARWLATQPRVLLLNDPTRGIDLNAKRDLYRVLRRLTREEGIAVVMISSEVDEQIELMDRVLVFRESTMSAELAHHEITRDGLVAAYFGSTL